MQRLIPAILLFIASCTGHASSTHTSTDTAKLFDPKQLAGKEEPTAIMLQNCIMIEGDSLKARLPYDEYKAKTTSDLKEFIQNNAAKISQERFYIVYANGTSYEKIIELINITRSAGIENYRAINLKDFPVLLMEPGIPD